MKSIFSAFIQEFIANWIKKERAFQFKFFMYIKVKK